MRPIKEAVRLRYELGLTMRQVPKSLRTAPSTASKVFRRAQAAGLTWPLPESWTRRRSNNFSIAATKAAPASVWSQTGTTYTRS